jgi:hypothetical protein
VKYTGTLSVPALGISVPVEVEIEPAAPPPTPDVLDDRQLRERWRCSARTTKRLRDQHRLRYVQPSARKFVYRLEDVVEYEAGCTRGVARRVGR